jgi:hypothetical protein
MRLALGLLCIFCVSAVILVNRYLDQWSGKVDPRAVESEIRNELPIGSPISTVDRFLSDRGIEHSFQPSTKTGYAVVRRVKGSNAIIQEDLGFTFEFDKALTLTSIQAKKELTGP